MQGSQLSFLVLHVVVSLSVCVTHSICFFIHCCVFPTLLGVFVFSSVVLCFQFFGIFYPVVLYSPPWLSIFHLLKAVAPVFTQRSHLDTECKSECRKILKKINTLVYNWSKMECPLDAFAYLETNKKTCCAFSVPDCFACINPTCVLCISICALSPALECIREKDTNISASCQSAWQGILSSADFFSSDILKLLNASLRRRFSVW